MFRADRIFTAKTGKVNHVDFVQIQNFRICCEIAVRVEQVERLHLRVVQLFRSGLCMIKLIAFKSINLNLKLKLINSLEQGQATLRFAGQFDLTFEILLTFSVPISKKEAFTEAFLMFYQLKEMFAGHTLPGPAKEGRFFITYDSDFW